MNLARPGISGGAQKPTLRLARGSIQYRNFLLKVKAQEETRQSKKKEAAVSFPRDFMTTTGKSLPWNIDSSHTSYRTA